MTEKNKNNSRLLAAILGALMGGIGSLLGLLKPPLESPLYRSLAIDGKNIYASSTVIASGYITDLKRPAFGRVECPVPQSFRCLTVKLVIIICDRNSNLWLNSL